MRITLFFSTILIILISFKPIDDFIILSAKKFNDYVKENPIVNIHLTTNQNKYTVGDTIFFKAFYFDSDFKPVVGKQILEAEIRDVKENLIAKISFRVINGAAQNQLVIPKQINPGLYRLVSYSQWMKNFPSKFYFSKDLKIVNKFQLEDNKENTSQDTISAFPEGGTLIPELWNEVLIKYHAFTEFKITNGAGDVILTDTTDRIGISKIKLKPSLLEKYYVETKNNKVSFGKNFKDGLAIELQPKKQNREAISFNLKIGKNSSLKNSTLYFITTSRNNITFSKILQFVASDSLTFEIPTKSIREGLNQAFVLDNKGDLISQRTFWRDPTRVEISINPNPIDSKVRSKSLLEITLSDIDGNPLEGEAVVSVNNSNLFDSTFASFSNEILLVDLPELKREILEKRITDEEWSIKANDLLIGSTWQRIPWKNIISEDWIKPLNKFKYSLNLRGKVSFRNSLEQIPDSSKLTIFLQKHMIGYDIYTGKDGYFELPSMYDYWDTDNVFYAAELKGKSSNEEIVLKIESDELATTTSLVSGKQTEKRDIYGDFKLKKETIDKSYNYYSDITTLKKNINLNQELENEVGGVDWQIKLDDYILFPTVDELIHELISFVKIRKKNGSSIIRMVLMNGTQNKYANSDPLLVIDGYMTKNVSLLQSLKTKDILTFKIVRDKEKLSKLGSIGNNGLIIIQTKRDKETGKNVIENNTIIKGLSQPISFQTNLASTNFRKPKFQSTILWDPNLIINESGKAEINFYSSDDIGDFELLLSGITKQGKPFSLSRQIRVRFK